MGLDVDYIAAKDALDEIKKILSSIDHGEREEIADEIIAFAEQLKTKYMGKQISQR